MQLVAGLPPGSGGAERLNSGPRGFSGMFHFYRPGAVRISLATAANLAVVAVLLLPPAAEARVFAQWVELGPDGASSVRAITDDVCPQAIFDGIPTSMNVRAEPGQKIENVMPAAFPVRSCEVAVPQGAVAATLDGHVLPLARPNPLFFNDSANT